MEESTKTRKQTRKDPLSHSYQNQNQTIPPPNPWNEGPQSIPEQEGALEHECLGRGGVPTRPNPLVSPKVLPSGLARQRADGAL